MNNDVQQEAQRVDQDVPLATLDLLARVRHGSRPAASAKLPSIKDLMNCFELLRTGE
jgi:hypothetical protein